MQTITFVSGKGGVGKTTLAANVAVALAQRKQRIAVIDLDPQNAQRLHLGMDSQEIAGLIREGVSPSSLFDSPFGIQFIPFGIASEQELVDFELELESNRHWLSQGIDSLIANRFDFVLLDTPPGPSVYLQQALAAAKLALIVVNPDAASFATIPKFISLVEQYTHHFDDFAGAKLVINQMPKQSKLGHHVRTAMYSTYADKLAPIAIQKDSHVAHALAFERPVLEFEPLCKASLDIQSLADWLIDSVRR
jgi:cellulose synthase operon protein YhjQ